MLKAQTCPRCNRITRRGNYCGARCKRESNLSGIIIGAYYEGPLKDAVWHLKYHHIKGLAEILGNIVSQNLKQNLPHKRVILMPVPIHSARERERGYNQAELLARWLSGKCKLRYMNRGLRKIKNTKTQVELSGRQRRRNLSGAFLYKGQNIEGKTIILIDDITTTHTTLEECARVLKLRGARAVWGFVLARN